MEQVISRERIISREQSINRLLLRENEKIIRANKIIWLTK